MERNENFATSDVSDITIHVAWPQLEIYADDIEQIQVMASGDAHTVNELRIDVSSDGELNIEQPQYGLSLDITHGHWLQLCVRVPRNWDHALRATTISGMLSARGLGGDRIVLETVTGDLKPAAITADEISLRTTAGAIRGNSLITQRLTGRSVSGDIMLDDVSAQTYRFTSVSGDMNVKLQTSFDQLDLRTVSGNMSILTEVEALCLSMRSVSGRKTVDGVKLTDDGSVPAVRATSVSGDLKIIGYRKS